MPHPESIFISYSTQDEQLARALCRFLEERHLRCRIAPRDIPVGRDYAQGIIEVIYASAIMILIFNRAANESAHVKSEVERAFNRRLVIMPFRIENMAPTNALAYFLSSKHWLDAFEGKAEDYFPALYHHCARVLLKNTPALALENEKAAKPIRQGQVKTFIMAGIVSGIVMTALLIVFANRQNIDTPITHAGEAIVAAADTSEAKRIKEEQQPVIP